MAAAWEGIPTTKKSDLHICENGWYTGTSLALNQGDVHTPIPNSLIYTDTWVLGLSTRCGYELWVLAVGIKSGH